MTPNVHSFSTDQAKAEVKNFALPDDMRTFPKGRLELMQIGGATIGRAVFDPGWRWATSVQPLVNTKSCEAPHFQYHVSGVLRVKMNDGSEFECKPGDVSLLPSGHDAWVIGDEPAVVVDFQGMIDYAASHDHASGASLLDGKSFHGMFIEKGKSTGDPDTLIFSNGRFRLTACDQYGYSDAVYSAIESGGTIHFNAETQRQRHGKLV